jgi:hypothetical protein
MDQQFYLGFKDCNTVIKRLWPTEDYTCPSWSIDERKYHDFTTIKIKREI